MKTPRNVTTSIFCRAVVSSWEFLFCERTFSGQIEFEEANVPSFILSIVVENHVLCCPLLFTVTIEPHVGIIKPHLGISKPVEALNKLHVNISLVRSYSLRKLPPSW